MASDAVQAQGPEGRPRRNEGPRRFAFALGTFHTAVLVVAGVLFAYGTERLDGLQDLNTWLGLALFALLWAASVLGTRWALGDVHVHAFDVALRRGMGGGARSGLAVVAAGLAVLVVSVPLGVVAGDDGSSLGDALVTALFVVGLYGTIAALVAIVVGGALGFVFAVVDWAILTVAGLGDGFDPDAE